MGGLSRCVWDLVLLGRCCLEEVGERALEKFTSKETIYKATAAVPERSTEAWVGQELMGMRRKRAQTPEILTQKVDTVGFEAKIIMRDGKACSLHCWSHAIEHCSEAL